MTAGDLELVSTGDTGLDLVLGGGLSLLARTEESSGSLLIRGGAGAGKTILALQIAAHVARGRDIAYGCVELLPIELQAQHRSVWAPQSVPGGMEVVAARSDNGDVFPGAGGDGPKVLAGLLDLGTTEDEHKHLGAAVEGLLSACESSGGKPSVLVIDSLVGGYGLGAKAPRAVSDGIVKLAAELGLFVIIAEEASGDPGQWRFAVDTVIELKHGGGGGSLARVSERDLLVSKHRFAPSEIGPHPYRIVPGQGVQCLPATRTYLRSWAREVLTWQPTSNQHEWGIPWLDDDEEWGGQAGQGVVGIYGSDTYSVRLLARVIASSPDTGTDLWLDLGSGEPQQGVVRAKDLVVPLADPQLRPEALLAACWRALDHQRLQQGVQRVIVGDLAALGGFFHSAGIQRAIGTLAELMRRSGIPVVLFETGPPHFDFREPQRSFIRVGTESVMAGWADTEIEIVTHLTEGPEGTHMTITSRHRARSSISQPAQTRDLQTWISQRS